MAKRNGRLRGEERGEAPGMVGQGAGGVRASLTLGLVLRRLKGLRYRVVVESGEKN